MKSKWQKLFNASKVIILAQQSLPANAFQKAEIEHEIIL